MFSNRLKNSRILRACFFFAVLLAGNSHTVALESDRSQKIRVKADSTERDEKRGITTFTGDVVIEQGSMNIVAQKVIVYGATAATRIIAKGKPARLRQQPAPDKGVITAEGNHIEYSLETEIVELQYDAYVEQEGTEVRGNKISYDMTQQIVRANSGTSGDSEDRVEVVIPAASPALDGRSE